MLLKEVAHSLVHSLFPHHCAGCGSDILPSNELVCYDCIEQLPSTNFHMHANNPIEKIFWGRLPLVAASSHLFFTKDSILQRLLHEFKYRGRREIGDFFGTRIGHDILNTNRFMDVDAIIPLPLFRSRQKRRGYNQSEIIASAISSITGIPMITDGVARRVATETQTKKGREDRWSNIDGKFEIINSSRLEQKHLLLIDDVITTGATIESCGHCLMSAGDVRLSIFSLAYTLT